MGFVSSPSPNRASRRLKRERSTRSSAEGRAPSSPSAPDGASVPAGVWSAGRWAMLNRGSRVGTAGRGEPDKIQYSRRENAPSDHADNRFEVWISKPLSYTMLPFDARVRTAGHPPPGFVASGPQSGCVLPSRASVPQTWRPSIQTVARLPLSESAKYSLTHNNSRWHMALRNPFAPARLLRFGFRPALLPSPDSGFLNGKSR